MGRGRPYNCRFRKENAMEAERINAIVHTIDDLAARSDALRRYL